jgi:hypothetical protein
MAVECPAPECDFAGHLDAVEGHIGGSTDGVHDGVVPSDLRESLHGEGSEGLAVGLLALVAVVLALWYLSRDSEQEESEDEESGPSEGLEAGGEW